MRALRGIGVSDEVIAKLVISVLPGPRQQFRSPEPAAAELDGRPGMVLCARCGEGTIMTIKMRIAQRDVIFEHCPQCDLKVWHRDGSVVSLDDVLELSRSVGWAQSRSER